MGIRIRTTLLCILFLLPLQLTAKTTVTSTDNPGFSGLSVPAVELSRFADDFQKRADANGPYFCNSYYLQNILGYGVGSPHIRKMDFGLVTGFAESNGSYFAGDASEGSYPAITPIMSLRFGMALSPKTDILAKLTIFDMYMINQEPSVSDVKIDDYRQFAIGAKYRYFLIGPRRILPFLCNFEGVSVGAGGDLMTGYLGVEGSYDNEMEDTAVDPGNGVIQLVDTRIEGDYQAMMRMLQLGACVEAISYFKVMRVMRFYTGLNVSLGWSWFGFEADSEGKLMAVDNSLDAQIGGGFNYEADYLALLEYDSQTIYSPYPLMPVYIAGIEFDILSLKMGLSTAVNFVNREDVALQFSVRYEL